jgi:hypothetical protein
MSPEGLLRITAACPLTLKFFHSNQKLYTYEQIFSQKLTLCGDYDMEKYHGGAI